MANTKDINSTERLLNVIRGVSQTPSATENADKDVLKNKKGQNKTPINFTKTLAGKRRFTIGVDISQDHVILTKTAKASDGKALLLDQKIIKLSSQKLIGTDQFTDILKSSITTFAGSLEDCEVWTAMNAADVNVQHIKIPKVPKKQLEKVIYWTAKKENPIDEKEMIFDFEMQGEIIDQGIPKYSVMIYSAPRIEVERIKALFHAAAINLTGITVAPFAIQNIFRTKWIDVKDVTFASLYIGTDYSRIDIYKNQNLVMTRGIKTGINSMIETIDESISEAKLDERAEKQKIKDALMNLMFDSEKATSTREELEWDENGIFQMIAPVVDRLSRQIERTLEYYASSVGFERVEKLYISSVMNIFYRPFLGYISEQLGVKTEFFDSFEGKSASTASSMLSPAIKASLIPAIGLALSDRKHTPNIIFTYLEKNKEIIESRINKGIFISFGTVIIICLVLFAFQAIESQKLSDKKHALEKELSSFHPLITKETINKLSDDIKARRSGNKQYAHKYRSLALIGELSSITPNQVKLIRIKMSASTTTGDESAKEVKTKEESISIEGVVVGERSNLDNLLAQYVVKLENSPMLYNVNIQKSNVVNFKKKEIIQFTINAKIG